MDDNPYLPPKAGTGVLDTAAWLPTLLPPFFSAMLLTPVTLFFFAGIAGWPSFLFRPGFIVSLTGCSLASALLLKPYRSANWLVRAILAPPICFVLLLLVIVGLRLVAA
jgi:hypothetical protein